MGDAVRGSTIVPVLVVRKRKPTPRYSCQPTSSFFEKLPLCSFFAINSLVVATSFYMILPSYTPSEAGECDLVTSEAVEAARSGCHGPIPYGLLVAGELLDIERA
jgi:hypothetical protein